MRLSSLGTAGIALACLPCLLVLFLGAGLGAGVLSVVSSVLSEPYLVLIAGFLAVLLFAAAAIAFVRRGAEPACETDTTPFVGDAGHPSIRQAVGSSRGGRGHEH